MCLCVCRYIGGFEDHISALTLLVNGFPGTYCAELFNSPRLRLVAWRQAVFVLNLVKEIITFTWCVYNVFSFLSNLPLASRKTRRSFSRSSVAVFKRTPSAPVTRRRARAAHVSGRWRYGCSELAHFLARARESAVASVSGFSTTNEWLAESTSAAGHF